MAKNLHTNHNILDTEKIFDVMDESKLKFFAKDDIIFHEGHPGFEAYYIKKGVVDIYRLSSNKHILLASLQPGEIFGEMSILSGEVRNANAIAKEDTTLVVIEKNILTSTMDETLPIVQSLAISLIKRLNNSNRKINEKPSNNTLLSVCTVLHLLFSKTIASRSVFSQHSPKNGIRYYELCKTIKDIVPLAEVDIDFVLDHLVKHSYVKIFSEKSESGQMSKWIVIENPKQFNEMIQKVKNSGGWVMENDPFIQDQEFLDFFDFAQMMNISSEELNTMLSQGDIPQNLLFLHRAGAATWMEDRHKKKMYRRLYDSPFNEIKKEKAWIA